MSAFNAISCLLLGTKANGDPSAQSLAATTLGPLTRTIGLQGDTLVVRVPNTTVPEEWDLTQPLRVAFGDGDTTITLGGYILRRTRAANWGRAFPVPASPPPPPLTTPHDAEWILETVPGTWRDGRGGLLTAGGGAGILNPLGPDGLVDIAHDNYRTNQELATLCLDAIGMAYEAVPITINTAVDDLTPLTAPGPLDWGNARALPELEALLARIGWVACLSHAGDQIHLVRLSRAGEPFVPDSTVTTYAEPYQLVFSAAVRPSKIIVSSGQTRTTIISERSLASASKPALVWCSFDKDAGAWVDEDPADLLDIFHAGPIGADETTRDFARAFTAVRLDESERETHSRFVTLPQAPAVGAFGGFGRSPCIVHARGAAVERGGEYQNVPIAGGTMRVDGATAVAGQGVFVLPSSIRFVKMTSPRGSHSDATPLTGTDLVVLFAHEAETGDDTIDHYRSGWNVVLESGVLVTVEQMEEEDLAEALTDASVVKVDAPFLRRVMTWAEADENPSETNDDTLDAIAKELALARVASADALSGAIVLRGLHDVPLGAMNGTVSAVAWFYADGWRTELAINQHEVPGSFFDRLEAEAGRSIGAGLSRLTLPGSVVAAANDVRSHAAPIAAPTATDVPESLAFWRGRPEDIAFYKKSAAPEPAGALPSVAEGSTLTAVITGSSGGSGNKWSYTWQEAQWTGSGYAAVVAGQTGLARNLVEYGNDGDDEESPGWNVANDLPEQRVFLSLKPIKAGTIVEVTRRAVAGDPMWFFQCANAVDVSAEPTGTRARIFARITGATLADGEDFIWDYGWEEMEHTDTGWQVKLDGRSSGGTLNLAFTANATTNKITPAASMAIFPDGASVRFTTTDTLPAPLATGTNYYGRWTSEGTGPYTLFPTQADALDNTNAIDITDTGSGVHSITRTLLDSGDARNTMEIGNPTGGIVSPGITLATLNAGFSLQPISTGSVVELLGPFIIAEGGSGEMMVPRWYFQASNTVDGECEE